MLSYTSNNGCVSFCTFACGISECELSECGKSACTTNRELCVARLARKERGRGVGFAGLLII